MNDEINQNDQVNPAEDRRQGLRRESDIAADGIITALQGELEQRDQALAEMRQELDATIEKLMALQNAPSTTVTVDDSEVRDLISTIAAARRAGHPDAQKHVESLLRLLGA